MTKKRKILAAFVLVPLLLALWPMAALAAPAGRAEGDGWIVGDATIQPGETKAYHLWQVWQGEEKDYMDGFIYWEILSAVNAGTTIAPIGVGTLTVAADETAATITIRGYDTAESYNYAEATYTIAVVQRQPDNGPPPEEGAGVAPAPTAESSFWLGVHAQLKAQGDKARVTATADGESFVPYYVVALMLNSDRTLTINRGLDTFVLTGAFATQSMGNSQSHSFAHLAAMLTPTENSRGGYTYR